MLKQIEETFVGGQTPRSALAVVKRLNKNGMRASLGMLLPAAKDSKDASANTDGYVDLLNKIKSSGADANVSIKLTTIGLSAGELLCKKNLLMILEAAQAAKNVVTIDMEDYKYKDLTLRVFEKAHEKHKNMRLTMQAYLHSSYHETKMLIEKNATIRLVKGAYSPSQSVAFKSLEDINKNYIEITKLLLNSDGRHAFATHDSKIIDFVKYAAKTKNIPKRGFELQMLYGVKNSLAASLAGAGYSVRIYVPFGKEWLPYVIRRIHESWR